MFIFKIMLKYENKNIFFKTVSLYSAEVILPSMVMTFISIGNTDFLSVFNSVSLEVACSSCSFGCFQIPGKNAGVQPSEGFMSLLNEGLIY